MMMLSMPSEEQTSFYDAFRDCTHLLKLLRAAEEGVEVSRDVEHEEVDVIGVIAGIPADRTEKLHVRVRNVKKISQLNELISRTSCLCSRVVLFKHANR